MSTPGDQLSYKSALKLIASNIPVQLKARLRAYPGQIKHFIEEAYWRCLKPAFLKTMAILGYLGMLILFPIAIPVAALIAQKVHALNQAHARKIKKNIDELHDL